MLGDSRFAAGGHGEFAFDALELGRRYTIQPVDQLVDAAVGSVADSLKKAAYYADKGEYEEALKILNSLSFDDPRVKARIQQAIDGLNAKQPSYATIKRFAIVPRDFTQEAGEMTPSLKVKRKAVTQKYQALLDAFYVE